MTLEERVQRIEDFIAEIAEPLREMHKSAHTLERHFEELQKLVAESTEKGQGAQWN